MAPTVAGTEDPGSDGFAADKDVRHTLRKISPELFSVAVDFWRAPVESGALSPRMRELVLLAMHATSTALNVEAIDRHVARARQSGATDEEIVDVLITIVAVANHALYSSVPILEQELQAAGIAETTADLPAADIQNAKDDFLAVRGFWNPAREQLMRLMRPYYTALHAISTETWRTGPLSSKEREFVCIAVDCTVTHQFEPGLRSHIKNALALGATRDEILHIFQLAGTLGLEGYLLAGRALSRLSATPIEAEPHTGRQETTVAAHE